MVRVSFKIPTNDEGNNVADLNSGFTSDIQEAYKATVILRYILFSCITWGKRGDGGWLAHSSHRSLTLFLVKHVHLEKHCAEKICQYLECIMNGVFGIAQVSQMTKREVKVQQSVISWNKEHWRTFIPLVTERDSVIRDDYSHVQKL